MICKIYQINKICYYRKYSYSPIEYHAETFNHDGECEMRVRREHAYSYEPIPPIGISK